MEVQNQGYLAILVPNKEVIHIMRERKRERDEEREMKRERDKKRKTVAIGYICKLRTRRHVLKTSKYSRAPVPGRGSANPPLVDNNSRVRLLLLQVHGHIMSMLYVTEYTNEVLRYNLIFFL